MRQESCYLCFILCIQYSVVYWLCVCCVLWKGVVKDDDTALIVKVLQYSEGDFPACKCYQAINRAGNVSWGRIVCWTMVWGHKGIIDHKLEQRSANLFCKEPDSKYFQHCGPYTCVATTELCHCSLNTAIDINEWGWLCASNTLLMKTDNMPPVVCSALD